MDQQSAPLTEHIAQILRNAIESGDFQVGDRLPSAALLTEQHGVSRTVVREAIAALRSEGLVESRRGAGVYVKAYAGLPFSPSRLSTLPEVIDMLEVRAAVEVEAAGLAAQRGSPAQHANIREALRAMESAMEGNAGDVGRSTAMDLDFHQSIATATNNPRFGAFLASLGLDAVPRNRLLSAEDTSPAASRYDEQLLVEHREIYAAIAARRSDDARDAMRRHLMGGLQRYQSLLETMHDKLI